MGTLADWTPITRGKVVVKGVHPRYVGVLDVRILLSAKPPPEWSKFFRRPLGVVFSGSPHRLELRGKEVLLMPADGELTEHVKHVDERIATANSYYELSVLPEKIRRSNRPAEPKASD
jgi:hypothetical protein